MIDPATTSFVFNNATIYTAVGAIIAAFISSGINILGNHMLKKYEYQNSVFSKIADKRLNAYEALEKSLFNSSKIKAGSKEDDSKDCPSAFFEGVKSFRMLEKEWDAVFLKRYLYSPKIRLELLTLIDIFNHSNIKLDQAIQNSANPDWDMRLIGEDIFLEFNTCLRNIYEEMANDQVNMHDIQAMNDVGLFSWKMRLRRLIRKTSKHHFPIKPLSIEKQRDESPDKQT